ncbi:unnamed protein product [Acanthoscelides obtectus]|uniref:Uncharacterized protein n=1 Tax=Acanthoscelides obtectus TaxID=200917 RepID=A0A9P0LC44_ACAOB|nr:unnamed protein product [Acanthoscelides obtectus]CAK1624593.1 hypothetical protein AOBTE_LOCUS2631 [Acanthoscelides obtectus]
MDLNFVQADNSNLPKVDALMVAFFFKNNADYYAAELKHVWKGVLRRRCNWLCAAAPGAWTLLT